MKQYNPDFKRLDELVDKGDLRKVISPCGGRLMLYNYTDQCTYSKAWNKHTLNSRGTVYEIETGKMVAKAFPKFFNFSELPTSKSRNLLKKTDFEVYEKMDGSLGIVYFYEGEWYVNTRGSFTSDQAVKAKDMLSKYYTSNLNSSITYLVEIIYPYNRIIVDYGDKEQLVLLAGYNIHTGEEVPLSELDKTSPFPVAPRHEFKSIQDIVDKQSELGKMEEGFVVRFPNGERAKFKSFEYLKVASIISNMTPLNFWKCMEYGKVRQEILEEIPEEFRDQSDKIKNFLEDRYDQVAREIDSDFKYVMRSVGDITETPEDCKAVGLFLKDHGNKLAHPKAMFPCLYGKDLDPYIMKSIRPSGNQVMV